MRIFLVLLFTFLALNAFAQSRRVNPNNTVKQVASAAEPAKDLTVKQMFDEANSYSKTKFAEFELKKIPFSETLRLQTQREQKQLAAKYAGISQARESLAGEDFYYLGLLHWIGENLDGTAESLRKFLGSENPAAEKVQTSRSIIVVIGAKQKNFDEAEKLLSEYLKNNPSKLSERSRMENELANAYKTEMNFAKAAAHAEEGFRAAKALFQDSTSRARGLDELLDAGMLVFESYRASGNQNEADKALDNMRETAAFVESSSFYYYAVDNKIKYLIETGRKPLAMETYLNFLIRASKDFTSKPLQNDVIHRLKKREKHYKMLGEIAPELESIDNWFPGTPQTFANLRGKVILLDFWATWCAPCIEAFPSLVEWQQDFSRDGLQILGVTKYTGMAEGFAVDNANEIAYLKRFRRTYGIPYDFVVTKDQTSQRTYGATAIPTAVLIDSKGVIRYLETGTSPTRLEELREMIVKLLAEK